MQFILKIACPMLWLPTLSITLHALTRNGVRRARFFSHFVAVFFDSARFRPHKCIPKKRCLSVDIINYRQHYLHGVIKF